MLSVHTTPKPLFVAGCNAPETRRRDSRRGANAIEFALVLPIFLIVVLGLIEYGFIIIVQESLTHSAGETAREISKIHEFDVNDGEDRSKAGALANSILATHQLSTDVLSPDSIGVLMIIETSDGVACLGDPSLEAAFCPTDTSISNPAETRVRIVVDINVTPVPQVLETFCIDLSDRFYDISALALNHCQ